MTLCQVMVQDFHQRTGRFDDRGRELYSERDLEFGILFAQGWMAEGYLWNEMGHFSLPDFLLWCVVQLRYWRAMG